MARRRTGWYADRWLDISLTLGGDNTTQRTVLTTAALHEWSHAPTIVRMVGLLRVGCEPNNGLLSGIHVWYGIRCVHDELPEQELTAANLANDDWMYTGYLSAVHTVERMPYWDGSAPVELEDVNVTDPISSVPFERINTRVMRKAPEPCELQLILSTAVIGSTPISATYSGYLRVLVKED